MGALKGFQKITLTHFRNVTKNWTFVYERLVFAASGKLEISTNGRYGLGNFWPVKSTNREGGARFGTSELNPFTKLESAMAISEPLGEWDPAPP